MSALARGGFEEKLKMMWFPLFNYKSKKQQ